MRIDGHRQVERTAVFQQTLALGEALTLAGSDPFVVEFGQMTYTPAQPWTGAHRFTKHYFEPGPGDLRIEGEEFECAVFLDELPEVECWVRNLTRRPGSFWLQTSSDRFCPDFVSLLSDGRILVVEYKGADRWDGLDAEEKRAVGAVWESRSNGGCLFVMPQGRDLNAIRTKVSSSR